MICRPGPARPPCPERPRGRRSSGLGPPGRCSASPGSFDPTAGHVSEPVSPPVTAGPAAPQPPAFLAGRGAASPRDASPPPGPGHMGGTAAASVTVLAAGVEPPSPPPPPADGAGIPVPGPRRPAPAASVGRPGLGPTVMERGGTSACSV